MRFELRIQALVFIGIQLLASRTARAHGSDPGPLPVDQAAASLVVLLVTLGGLGLLLWVTLRGELGGELRSERRHEVLGWMALSVVLGLCLVWAYVRSATWELLTPLEDPGLHDHYVLHGGMVAMWGDYHIEVVRSMAGEYQIWLSDDYRRPISAEHFEGRITPTDRNWEPVGSGVVLTSSLDKDYRFARLRVTQQRIKVQLDVPGVQIRLKLAFDKDADQRSLPRWCGSTP